PDFTVAMRRLLHEFSWNAPFAPLDVPCLLISGTRDPLLPRSSAKSYSDATPGLRHIEIRDAGHVVFDEAPLAVNEAMIEFLRMAMESGV
ncbi:MAG: alpha/beta hydrolase, partial [Gemmatimonadota bacterium]|nr:alpha/beta hydrolase [Gemmatimonadota bacterium]